MRHMWGRRAMVMRRGAYVLAWVLLVAGCSESGADPTTTSTVIPSTTAEATTTTTATTAATTTSTTTTTEAPTTTTADPLARPDKLVSNFDRDSVDDFDTTGDDLYRVGVELGDLYNFLQVNPAETVDEMLDLMFTEDFAGLDMQRQYLAELVDNNWHYLDPGIEIVAVDVLSVDGDIATLRSATRSREQLVADESGEIVKTYPGWVVDAYVYTVVRGEDGRWRVSGSGPYEPISDDELAGMVPVEWTGRS